MFLPTWELRVFPCMELPWVRPFGFLWNMRGVNRGNFMGAIK